MSSSPVDGTSSISSAFSTSRGFTEPGSTNQFFLRSYSSISRCWAFGSRVGIGVVGAGRDTSMAPPRELPARNTSNCRLRSSLFMVPTRSASDWRRDPGTSSDRTAPDVWALSPPQTGATRPGPRANPATTTHRIGVRTRFMPPIKAAGRGASKSFGPSGKVFPRNRDRLRGHHGRSWGQAPGRTRGQAPAAKPEGERRHRGAAVGSAGGAISRREGQTLGGGSMGTGFKECQPSQLDSGNWSFSGRRSRHRPDRRPGSGRRGHGTSPNDRRRPDADQTTDRPRRRHRPRHPGKRAGSPP